MSCVFNSARSRIRLIWTAVRYTQEDFEEVFRRFFSVLRREAIHESARTLYLMRARDDSP